jgi:hypothetical protein
VLQRTTGLRGSGELSKWIMARDLLGCVALVITRLPAPGSRRTQIDWLFYPIRKMRSYEYKADQK